MNLLKRKSTAFAIAALFALNACTAFGVRSPETFNERLAVGYVTVTTVRTTALSLLQSRQISVEDAENVQAQADNARAGLDIAVTLSGTDVTAAENRLAVSLTVLSALQSYLQQERTP